MKTASTFTWQFAWQVPPSMAVGTAAVVLLVILVVPSSRRSTLAQLAVVSLLLAMLSGVSQVPPMISSDAAKPEPRLVDLVLPASAWRDDTIAVQAVAWGSPPPTSEGTPWPSVELFDGRGQLIESLPLTAAGESPGGQHLWTATFSWRPTEPGVHTLSAQLAGPPPRDDTPPPAMPAVCGVADSPLRVLILDGLPRWETRHLQQLLKATPGIETELVLLESDATAQLPLSRSAAAEFDAVVLGSFDARDLPPAAAEAILMAAEQDGLGIVWCLDGRCDLAGLAASQLGALLPCSGDPMPLPLPATSGHQISAAPAADGFPWLTPLLRAVEETRATVFLPAQTVGHRGTAIAPLVLAPALPSADSPQPAVGRPALLIDHTATGRIVTMLMETWRFRIAGSSEDVDAFWQAAIRFAAEPRATQRLGRPLAEAAMAAARQRQAILQPLSATASTAVPQPLPPWRQLGWNHPVLLAMVIVLAAVGWMPARPQSRTGEPSDAA